MNIQERDSRGRFEIKNLKEVEARIAASNEKAKKIIRICDALGITGEMFGVKQWENGNYHIETAALYRLSGLALGIVSSFQKSQEELMPLFMLINDALKSSI